MCDKTNSDEILVVKDKRSTNEEDENTDRRDNSAERQKLRVHQALPEHAVNSGAVQVCRLPPEVLIRVFRWLSVPDLCRMARVCAEWRVLVMQKSLWSDVIVTQVFRWLSIKDLCRVALVCKRWRELAYQKSIWRQFTIELDGPDSTYNWEYVDHPLDSLLQRGISKIRTASHIKLHEVSKHCPDLRRATLIAFDFSPVTWSGSLLQRMTNLTELNVQTCSVRLTDDSMKLLAEHLNKLVTLQIDNCESLTNRFMEYIATGLPELKNLQLVGGDFISDVGVGYLCGIGLGHPPAKLPQLQDLYLGFSSHYTDLAVHHLSRGQPSLKKLSLCSLENLSDASCQWLATMRELSHLTLFRTSLNGSGLIELVNAQSPITYLKLNGCELLTDQALEQVSRLKQLRSLIISFTNISDAGLEQLVKCGDCPISTLDIKSCKGISADGMRHVARLKQLLELDFEVCDVGLAHLADGQSPVAQVTCGSNATDAGLRHLARLPNLQRLDLSSCKNITDAGFEEFVTNVRGSLTELRLGGQLYCNSWCKGLHAGTLSRVARGLPALTKLWLGSSHLDDDGVEMAASLLPRLQSIFVFEYNIINAVRDRCKGLAFWLMFH